MIPYNTHSEQVCYEIDLQPNPDRRTGYECNIVRRDEENSHELGFLPPDSPGGMLTITSPNFGIAEYPSDYLCLYSIPNCPNPTDLYYVSWRSENFILEDAGDFFFLSDICTDLVELTTPSDQEKLEDGGATLRDFQGKTLCGNQGDFNDTSSGTGLFVSTKRHL